MLNHNIKFVKVLKLSAVRL